ncbi:hypothetical protein VMCG_03670 [Cytospora schulzeri]|uniref:Haloacid dehalogenase, type II n=1 Tax=Cytospora schulzeri TaxID=448051 RepID=A0A423WW48_9PEZI|nr:hypothetical protein VMCG_03670 [Valsa malicola]
MAQIDNTGDLTQFKALSFDCYGTLIEWEPSLIQALQPIIAKLPSDHAYVKDNKLALQRFDHFSNGLEHEQPKLKYDLNLTTAMKRLAAELGVADAVSEEDYEAIGKTPGTWPAFADTIEGLRTLKKHYKLIILSNIDNANIAATTSGPLGAVPFDAVYTAEDIGSYKPARANFDHLFRRARDELGVDVDGGELLHVARSLRVDHSAAKAVGFRSCWISRGGERKEGQGIGGDYEDMLRKGLDDSPTGDQEIQRGPPVSYEIPHELITPVLLIARMSIQQPVGFHESILTSHVSVFRPVELLVDYVAHRGRSEDLEPRFQILQCQVRPLFPPLCRAGVCFSHGKREVIQSGELLFEILSARLITAIIVIIIIIIVKLLGKCVGLVLGFFQLCKPIEQVFLCSFSCMVSLADQFG